MEKGHVNMRWGFGRELGDWGCYVHTTVCKTARGRLLPSTRSQLGAVLTSRAGGGRVGGSTGRGLYLFIADSLCHIAETNTTLESNYTPIKIC